MIFTFYSYKGGVGRSMALANVAVYLCQLDFSVLIIDWDLESPGLHRFFGLPDDGLTQFGVIDLLLDYKQKMSHGLDNIKTAADLPFAKPQDHAIDLATASGKLSLLSAGRGIGNNFTTYAKKVHDFDWNDFYDKWQGARYFTWLREQLNKMADFILIDSRTGVTEMGGVSTLQLADMVVLFCAPNQQNMDGVERMAATFTSKEVKQVRNDRPLNVIVTPSRIERAESNLLDKFQKEFKHRFWPFMAHQAKGIFEEKDLWNLLNIPYVAKYAFSEAVAMEEELGKLSATDMQAAYTNLTAVMMKLGLAANDARLQKFLENESSIPAEEKTFLDIAKVNGVGYDVLDVKCVIGNDGSATILRRIKATAFRSTPFLQTYLLITGEEVDVDIETGTLNSLDSDRNLYLQNQKEEYGRLTAQIAIAPPLNYGESVEYTLEEKLNSELFAIGKSKEEISSRKSRDDFFNWHINNPTRKLIMEVHFPHHAKPNHYETEVGFGTTDARRLSKPKWIDKEQFEGILMLEIDYPKVGLTYGIRWEPLATDG